MPVASRDRVYTADQTSKHRVGDRPGLEQASRRHPPWATPRPGALSPLYRGQAARATAWASRPTTGTLAVVSVGSNSVTFHSTRRRNKVQGCRLHRGARRTRRSSRPTGTELWGQPSAARTTSSVIDPVQFEGDAPACVPRTDRAWWLFSARTGGMRSVPSSFQRPETGRGWTRGITRSWPASRRPARFSPNLGGEPGTGRRSWFHAEGFGQDAG